ncbi:CPBP family glutamic-type intramembrane protease [Flavobacterium sp.]|uniref:CPBP family glutamic-type intramembrane protease n=1 Tax=Flavobacterium sp. TaxID=239 RepID=UPI00345CFF1A
MVIILPLDFIVTRYLHFESIVGLIHQTQNRYDNYPIYLTVFIGPFIEEILFRLGLVVNKKNISIFLSILVHEILRRSFIKLDFQNVLYFYIIVLTVISFILAWTYLTPQIINSIQKKKKWLIVFSIISFGLLHITNIKIIHPELILFYPFFVLPQSIMGYFITNLRLKNGFFWGLLLHSLFNFIAIVL